MKIGLKFALLFSGTWFLGKYLFFYFQLFQSSEQYTIQVLWNILCLLLAMSIGSLIEKRSNSLKEFSALADLKTILGIGLIYSVIVSVLIYVYYAKIDPSYNENQIAQIEMSMEKTLSDKTQLKKFKHERPEFASMSKEEILERSRDSIKAWYQPKTTMIISMLGMLMLSIINALVLTIIYRKVLFRK